MKKKTAARERRSTSGNGDGECNTHLSILSLKAY